MPKRQHARQPSPTQAKLTQQPSTLNYKPRTTPRIPLSHTTPRLSILRSRKIPLVLAGLAVAGTSFYGVSIYLGYKRDAELALTRAVPLDVSDRYNRTAQDYDASVDRMEWLMGLDGLRKKLTAKARGHVLEASVGTGRNMAYYPLTKGIKSVTMVDRSAEMITVARIKWAKTNAYFMNAVFRIQDAGDRVPCSAPGGFDTVVQTMGVCSTPEPEKVLRNLGEMTNPEGGRILLLEHGKSHYAWMNRMLDTFAPAHADRHGCWFNKDVGDIVERSGLEVVEAKRYHFGTTWWFVLKPKPRPVVVEEVMEKDKVEALVGKPGRWWWS